METEVIGTTFACGLLVAALHLFGEPQSVPAVRSDHMAPVDRIAAVVPAAIQVDNTLTPVDDTLAPVDEIPAPAGEALPPVEDGLPPFIETPSLVDEEHLADVNASPCSAGPTRSNQQPAWVLPVEAARQKAMKTGRPILIVSLNGNLDGHC